MALRTDSFDLSGLHLSSGEGRRLEPAVAIEPFELAGERYEVTPDQLLARLDVSRTTGGGYSLREIKNEPELAALRSDVRYREMLGRNPLSSSRPYRGHENK